MKAFNQLCKELEALPADAYNDTLAECAARVIPALAVITEDGLSGAMMFGLFVMSALAADGRCSKGEYEAVNSLLEPVFGEAIDYQALKKHFKEEKGAYKQYADMMVRIIGLVSDDVKNDIVFLCLLICAVDGKISLKERLWIEQLINA